MNAHHEGIYLPSKDFEAMNQPSAANDELDQYGLEDRPYADFSLGLRCNFIKDHPHPRMIETLSYPTNVRNRVDYHECTLKKLLFIFERV